jgi:hypothetical protein
MYIMPTGPQTGLQNNYRSSSKWQSMEFRDKHGRRE